MKPSGKDGLGILFEYLDRLGSPTSRYMSFEVRGEPSDELDLYGRFQDAASSVFSKSHAEIVCQDGQIILDRILWGDDLDENSEHYYPYKSFVVDKRRVRDERFLSMSMASEGTRFPIGGPYCSMGRMGHNAVTFFVKWMLELGVFRGDLEPESIWGYKKISAKKVGIAHAVVTTAAAVGVVATGSVAFALAPLAPAVPFVIGAGEKVINESVKLTKPIFSSVASIVGNAAHRFETGLDEVAKVFASPLNSFGSIGRAVSAVHKFGTKVGVVSVGVGAPVGAVAGTAIGVSIALEAGTVAGTLLAVPAGALFAVPIAAGAGVLAGASYIAAKATPHVVKATTGAAKASREFIKDEVCYTSKWFKSLLEDDRMFVVPGASFVHREHKKQGYLVDIQRSIRGKLLETLITVIPDDSPGILLLPTVGGAGEGEVAEVDNYRASAVDFASILEGEAGILTADKTPARFSEGNISPHSEDLRIFMKYQRKGFIK